MKIAVVGAGIFGITIALELEAAGHGVALFEKENSILSSASRCNQYRLHMGYHYPRSLTTMKACWEGLASFNAAFGDAIVKDVEQIYCIAKEGSKTAKDDYLSTLHLQGLEYKVRDNLSHIKYENIDLAIQVPEKMFNYFILKGICEERLAESGVYVKLGTSFKPEMVKYFDQVIIVTYRDNNDFCKTQKEYQFELVEKLVLYIPNIASNLGTVVLDGGFCCLDPFPGLSGLFLMGHVDYAIHSRNTGTCHFLPTMHNDVLGYDKLLNKGIIPASELYNKTNALVMIEAGKRFFNYTNPIHIGSMFTYRVVLPNADKTDERPSVVERIDEKVITVFGGKIPTVIDTARKVVTLLEKEA